jgi:hypothetical protein
MVDTKKSRANDQPQVPSAVREVQVEQIGMRWAEFLILQLALVGGGFAAFFAHRTSDAWLAGGGWQTIFIASAAMSIGFGAAMLLYGRLGSRQAEQLEADYQSLVARTDSLLNSSSIGSGERS